MARFGGYLPWILSLISPGLSMPVGGYLRWFSRLVGPNLSGPFQSVFTLDWEPNLSKLISMGSPMSILPCIFGRVDLNYFLLVFAIVFRLGPGQRGHFYWYFPWLGM
jgi:hypothetical protein